MADDAELATYISEQVDAIRARWGVNEGRAFTMWYAMEGLGLDEDVAYEAATYDGGNDKDIDLFYVDDTHERVVICQGKFNRKGAYKASKNELLGLLHAPDWLSSAETMRREGRADLASAADDYSEAVARGYSVDFHYVFMGPSHRDTIDQAALYAASVAGEYPSRSITVVDMPALRAIRDDAMGRETRVPQEAFQLSPGKYFSQTGWYGDAYAATLPTSELRRIHQLYGDRLFVRNVRLFLGVRAGGVNAGIRNTLSSPNDRGNFWAYNNGITIVGDSLSLDPRTHKLTLSNFSIVNGCQTTVSLANAGEDETKPAEVLVRFIAAPERLIDNIIFYTNSQTPIKGWELRSQDKIHKRLQQDFAADPNPYYYALRRGEARTLTGPQRDRYTRDGRLQTIQHDVLAQHLAAFRGLPYIAYKEKGKIFSTYYDSVFPNDITAEEALLAWRVGEAADTAVRKELQEAIATGKERELDVAILKRGGRLLTVWVISYLLDQRNGPNYVKNLRREVVTSNATLDRLATYAQVAVIFYLRATRQLVGNGAIDTLASILRTQESFPRLKAAVSEAWKVQSIDKQWVNALPRL
jgi:hypothetical protein